MAFFIANFVLFQAVWWSCVLGAGAYSMHWLAWLVTLLFLAVSWFSPLRREDWLIVAAMVLAGTLLDNLWIGTGILSYPSTSLAPYWISLLWVGFGLTVNHSMRWFRDKGALGALVVGAFAPITYFSGDRFGAVVVENTPGLAMICIAWFALFWAVSSYAAKADQVEEEVSTREAA